MDASESMTGPGLLEFAEDPDAFLLLGPDEERVVTDRSIVTFSPGAHFWSTTVARVRFGDQDVRTCIAEIRALMRERGRRAAAWSVGPSATPRDVRQRLHAAGLEAESDQADEILVLTEPPRLRVTAFGVRRVSTFEEHLAAIEVANVGFAFSEDDADDERRRARETFDVERAGGHVLRFVAFDDAQPVAAAYGCLSPHGIYLGGAATIPSHRGRGAMSAVAAAIWSEAVGRGTPTIVTYAGPMSRSPLRRLGFRAIGHVHHLIDRVG